MAEKETTKAEKETTKAEKGDREIRWDAFLEEARKVNPERFDRQKENGEFDTIPTSFV